MAKELPARNTEKWTFQLEKEHTLRFRITSQGETNGQILISDHDISILLDYLYENRELIYEATHGQEHNHLEAVEIIEANSQRIEPVRYFDDGVERIRAN